MKSIINRWKGHTDVKRGIGTYHYFFDCGDSDLEWLLRNTGEGQKLKMYTFTEVGYWK